MMVDFLFKLFNKILTSNGEAPNGWATYILLLPLTFLGVFFFFLSTEGKVEGGGRMNIIIHF